MFYLLTHKQFNERGNEIINKSALTYYLSLLYYERTKLILSHKLQRLKILTTPWRDTQQRNADLSSVANGAIRRSFSADQDLNLTKEQQELTKEQTEVMIPSREGANGDPPPEPV